MNKKCLILCLVLTTLIATSNAASQSISCVWINKERKCVATTNPGGNTAVASAETNGGNGIVATGAGTQDNWDTDFQQIGYEKTNVNEGGDATFPIQPLPPMLPLPPLQPRPQFQLVSPVKGQRIYQYPIYSNFPQFNDDQQQYLDVQGRQN